MAGRRVLRAAKRRFRPSGSAFQQQRSLWAGLDSTLSCIDLGRREFAVLKHRIAGVVEWEQLLIEAIAQRMAGARRLVEPQSHAAKVTGAGGTSRERRVQT